MCRGHKIVPSFYLLGVQKAATTYFSEIFRLSSDFVHARLNHSSDAEERALVHSDKELYNFADSYQWDKLGGEDGWLEQFPQCNGTSQDERSVLADFTPVYFATQFSPAMLHTTYGLHHAGRLRFFVALREPVSRMYSEYWTFKNLKYYPSFWAARPMFTFHELASEIIRGSGCFFDNGTFVPEQCVDDFSVGFYSRLPAWMRGFVDKSRYGSSLRMWFEAFSPKQFTIVPVKYMYNSANMSDMPLEQNATEWFVNEASSEQLQSLQSRLDSPVEYAWRLLGMKVPDITTNITPDRCKGEYPIMEELLGIGTAKRLTVVINHIMGPEVVADALYQQGADLWKCEDLSLTGIADWLRNNW